MGEYFDEEEEGNPKQIEKELLYGWRRACMGVFKKDKAQSVSLPPSQRIKGKRDERFFHMSMLLIFF